MRVIVCLLLAGTAAGFARADEPRTADYKLTIEELFKEGLADPKAATKKYKGKTIEVEGKVESANKVTYIYGFNLFGPKNPPKNNLFVGLVCGVRKADLEKGFLLGGGQKVRVVGTSAGFADNGVWLTDCSFTELEKCTTPRLKATKMTEEFARDATAAEKKYFKARGETVADVIVEGVVEKLVKENLHTVYLKGTGGVAVTAPLEKAEWDKLKVGDTVALKGDYANYYKSDKKLGLNSAFLVPSDDKKAKQPGR